MQIKSFLDEREIHPGHVCDMPWRIFFRFRDGVRFRTFYLSIENWNQILFRLFFSGKHSLRVREHNILGPYVDGLSTLAVSSFQVWTMELRELGLSNYLALVFVWSF